MAKKEITMEELMDRLQDHGPAAASRKLMAEMKKTEEDAVHRKPIAPATNPVKKSPPRYRMDR